jgi:hypothetical protein
MKGTLLSSPVIYKLLIKFQNILRNTTQVIIRHRVTRNVCITKYACLYKLSNSIMVMILKWIGFFPFHRGIMWSSLVKIQYTELKLSCGNDLVVKYSIYSNSDLDLWPNYPKINSVLSLSQGNHVAKFVKDPIYRTKVIVRKLPCCQKLYL